MLEVEGGVAHGGEVFDLHLEAAFAELGVDVAAAPDVEVGRFLVLGVLEDALVGWDGDAQVELYNLLLMRVDEVDDCGYVFVARSVDVDSELWDAGRWRWRRCCSGGQ